VALAHVRAAAGGANRVTPAVLQGIRTQMTEAGLSVDADWLVLTRDGGWTGELSARQRELLGRSVRQMNRQIEHSPMPAGEWGTVLGALGEDKTSSLLGISVSSIRRYAAAERTTPQLTAERLHFLALVLTDLAGSYNDFGIRRRFDRRRSALADRTPTELLVDFEPDGADTVSAATLAAELVGLGAA